MSEERREGAEPQTVGKCADCGNVYTVYRTAEGNLHPVGTDGSCTCGNETFEILQEP